MGAALPIGERQVLGETQVAGGLFQRDSLHWSEREEGALLGWRHAPLFLQLLRIPWHGRLLGNSCQGRQGGIVLSPRLWGALTEELVNAPAMLQRNLPSSTFVLHNLVLPPIIFAHTISEGCLGTT